MAEPCEAERQLIALLYTKLIYLSELAEVAAGISAEWDQEEETADSATMALSVQGMIEVIDESREAIRQHGFAS